MIVFEDFRNIIVSIEMYVISIFYIEDWGYVCFYVFEMSDMGYQCFMCQYQMFIQQFLEGGFIVFCFQSNMWQVQVDYVEVVMIIVDLFVVFIFLYVEEVVVVYWGFK